MSETEHWRGKLKKLTLPDKCNTWKLQVEYLQLHGYEFEDLDFDEEYFYTNRKAGQLINQNNSWYEIIEINEIRKHNDEQIAKVTRLDKDIIKFEVRFYNGGACFDEMIEEAFKNEIHE